MNLDDFTCMLCAAKHGRPWLENCSDVYLGKSEPVHYAECCVCSLVQQHPRPDDVRAWYVAYPMHTQRGALQKMARRLFQRQVYYHPTPEAKSQVLLDYGCGGGTYLAEVGRLFQSMCGYEPGAEHAQALSENLQACIYVDAGRLDEEQAGAIDVITVHYVLEHVMDLHAAFKSFQVLLKPGGLLYIAVPNIRSWEAQLFKRRWHGLDAPRHLQFPEACHLDKLAKEYGFEVTRIAHAVFPNTLAGSLATIGNRCRPLLLMAFVPFSWLVNHAAPQGTLIAHMHKKV